MRKNSTSRRQLRIAKIIKKEVSNLLQRQFFYEGNFTISRVELNNDLKIAYVYISEIESILLEQINQKLPAIQLVLAKILHLKYVPKIKIIIDEDLVSYNLLLDKLL